MAKLVGEELEADEEFWGHGTWDEAESDGDFDGDEEERANGDEGASDDADSDFDKPEEADEAVVGEAEVAQEAQSEAKRAKNAPGRYVDPKKKASASSAASASSTASRASPAPRKPRAKKAKAEQTAAMAPADDTAAVVHARSLRASTKEYTAKAQEREKEEIERRAAKKQRRASSVAPGATAASAHTAMTQEERLEEAKETEELNRRQLEEMLLVFEERKQLTQAVKARKQIGSGITTVSRVVGGTEKDERYVSNTITFPNQECVPAILSCTQRAPPPPPPAPVCAITGLPAKYKDPASGLPFATVGAFKAIRERMTREEEIRVNQQLADITMSLDEKRARFQQLLRNEQQPQHQTTTVAM